MVPVECKTVKAILMSDYANRNTSWVSWVLILYEHRRSQKNRAGGFVLCSIFFAPVKCTVYRVFAARVFKIHCSVLALPWQLSLLKQRTVSV